MNFHIVYGTMTLIAVIGGGALGSIAGIAWIGALIGLFVAFIVIGPDWAEYYFSRK